MNNSKQNTAVDCMPEYEFSEKDAEVVKRFATKCLIEAILIAVIGILGIIGPSILLGAGLLTGGMALVMIIQNILFVVIGAAFYPPYENLRNVAITQGSDIPELMKGMRKLNKLFVYLIYFVLASMTCDIIMIVLS